MQMASYRGILACTIPMPVAIKAHITQCDSSQPSRLYCQGLGVACSGYVKRRSKSAASSVMVKTSKARSEMEGEVLKSAGLA